VPKNELSPASWITLHDTSSDELLVPRCRIDVVGGPDAGRSQEFCGPVIRIGARHGNDLVLTDRKVSGLHLEIRHEEHGYRLRDLESTNGTFVHGMRVADAFLPPGTPVTIGRTQLVLTRLDDGAVPLYPGIHFGQVLGQTPVMRRLFAVLEQIAPSSATVLITGETGTGKEVVAEAIHAASPRRAGPFVVVDCGAIAETLFENELFGHERGAFTGASQNGMRGAFEHAHGGTLFLDEIGELPLALQPKLLRAVQTRQIRRIGGSRVIDCDVRVIAATNRDLAREVNRGTFREDLYYRLAVACVHLPALRERREDIPLLVANFLEQLFPDRRQELPAEVLDQMMGYYWPGNVRELRNAVERAVLQPAAPALPADLEGSAELMFGDDPGAMRVAIDTALPFKVAKQQVMNEFERRFTMQLLRSHGWNVSAAARASGLDRVSLHKVLRRLGLRRN
jgi:transcriptional regulator with GAF, ATPase, and Fis domain